MTADGSKKKKPRWLLLWVRRIALALLASFVVSLAGIWLWLKREESHAKEELAAVVAETDAGDARWRWEEIREDLEPIADADNSALVVQKTVGSFAPWRPGTQRLADGSGLLDVRPAANVRLDAERLGLIRRDLGTLGASLALAVSLKDHPRGRAPIELTDDVLGTMLPHAQHARQVVYLLELDVERLLHEGRAAQVPDRVRAILNAGASVRDDGMLICALVRVAVRGVGIRRVERALGMAVLPDDTCQALARLLEEEGRENPLLPALRGERAAYFRLFENLRSGKVSLAEFLASPGGPPVKPSWWSRLLLSWYHYRLPDDQAFFLGRMNDLCEIARSPVEQHAPALAVFDAELRGSKAAAASEGKRILSHLLMPAVNKVGEATIRDQANFRCILTALAAERYRLANKRWPRSLDDLCPAYLPAVPLDPFSGGPLLLAAREDGIVIYSVGRDGEDDGGEVVAPRPDQTSADFGFRLYDADKRNLPAADGPRGDGQ